jgi:hypothetical protein
MLLEFAAWKFLLGRVGGRERVSLKLQYSSPPVYWSMATGFEVFFFISSVAH